MKIAVIFNKKETDIADVINIFGPQTKEHYNPKTVELVTTALEKGGHNVRIIEGNKDVVEELGNFMPRVISGERPGMVFNMAYGIQGQSRYSHIPAMLEMLGVPYVGSGPQGHSIALDKIMSKIVFRQHKLPTPPFWIFSDPDKHYDDIVYPVIVKPKMESVSMGMSIVHNSKDLPEAVREVIETYHQQALVESFIPGREFAVGLLGNGASQEVFPIVEIDFKGNPDAIQTFDEKMHNPSEKVCPAEIDDSKADELKRLARSAFQALELNDFARVDFRMDQEGNIYILEINSMASLGKTGSYVYAAKKAGYTYDSLVNRMLDVAAVRYLGDSILQESNDAAVTQSKTQPLRVRIRSHVRSQLTTMEDSIHKMVNINTHVYNTEGVNTLGTFMTNRLVQLRFSRQVYPQNDVGNILYLANHDSETNDILLLSHLDNEYSHKEFVAFREERGRFFGSGVAESKGGLTVLLAALQALRFTRRLRSIKVGILLTTDDSLGGYISKKFVAECAQRSNCVIGLKYGETDGGVVISCSGRRSVKVEFSNMKWGKSVTTPNVILHLCKKIIALQKQFLSHEGIVITPTSIESHSSPGSASDYAVASFDVQFSDKVQENKIDTVFNRIINKNLNGKIQARFRKGYYRPAVHETELNKRFLEQVQKISDQIEVRIKAVNRTRSSDICYVSEGIPVLDGFGPVGGGAGTPGEFVVEDSLIDRAALLALIINESIKGLS